MKFLSKLLCLLLMCSLTLAEEPPRPVLEVHQMDVGFADAYLLRCGDLTVVIDGGEANPKQPEHRAEAYLRSAGVTEIDVYVITHWHLDHCMNLGAILSAFGTEDTVVYGPSPAVHKDFSPLPKGTYVQMKAGDEMTWGDMRVKCVGPKKLMQQGACNQDSLNFLLTYGERRLLFTGDFAQSAQILDEYADDVRNVDVLKFPHHGMAPYEIGNKAAGVVRPKYVLVPGVLSKYALWSYFDNKGIKVPQEHIYTVGDGNVVMLIDGQTIEVHTHADPRDYVPQT